MLSNLGMLSYILRKASAEIKTLAYMPIFCPILEYACAVRSLLFKRTEITKLEAVEKKELRWA